jgi:hypothetical protein
MEIPVELQPLVAYNKFLHGTGILALIGRLLALIVLAVVSTADTGKAADPTWGQCSCPAATDAKAPDRYSVIDNASLCVNTEGTAPEPLCSITVHCLDDATSGPNCGEQPINQNWPDSSTLSQILPSLTNDHYERRGVRQPFSVSELSRILDENADMLKECWRPFLNYAVGETGISIAARSTKELSCVNTPSGWLHIVIHANSLKIDPNRNIRAVAFQFSPLR